MNDPLNFPEPADQPDDAHVDKEGCSCACCAPPRQEDPRRDMGAQ